MKEKELFVRQSVGIFPPTLFLVILSLLLMSGGLASSALTDIAQPGALKMSRDQSLNVAGPKQWSDKFGWPGISGSVNAMVTDDDDNLYLGGLLNGAGGVFVNSIVCWDGSDWHGLGSGMGAWEEENARVSALAIDGSGDLYAGGRFAKAGGVTANNIARWDGSHWSALGSGVDFVINALAADGNGNLYAGGSFTEAGGVAVSNIARWDGSNWHALGSGVNSRVQALTVGSDGYLYAGGDFSEAGGVTVNNISRWDGSNWHALGSGVNDPNYVTVEALATDGNGDLYAGGLFSDAGGVTVNNIARWDGSNWYALGNGVDGSVSALATDGNGDLYAGGSFTSAGALTANRIARWDGSSWHALGSGIGDWGSINPYVTALATDGGDTLYAGGGFGSTGGVLASSIASWDGSDWSALRGSSWQGVGRSDETGGLAHDGNSNLYMTYEGKIAHWDGSGWHMLAEKIYWVFALATDVDGNLYAGGTFTEIEGVSANYIARWDGSKWHALGSGVGGGVSALATDGDGNLYAGGWFTEAGGVAVNNIARWDGSSWHALGDGVNGEVLALATDGDGNLYAGGAFITEAGSVTVNNIARWDGSNWHALGSGLGLPGNVRVNALATDTAGNLYAGGGFTEAGGVAVNNIARWDGSKWHALGSGVNSYVRALTVDGNGDLYAGGDFLEAGGVTVNRIAHWDGNNWHALGSGVNKPGDDGVCCLALDGDDNLYVGGTFSEVGGKPAAGIALWTEVILNHWVYLPLATK
jgi:hypothetical protein